MANSTKDSRNTPNLEELLRFKRSERPDEAFWQEFDGELHQRMMQALVKKDPWPIQLLRGLTGKFAQTSAIAAAAAVLALVALRPAFVPSDPGAQSQPAPAALAQTEIGVGGDSETFTNGIDSKLVAEADYEIETLTATVADDDASVTQDFGLDHIEVTSYESDAYSADMSFSGLTSTGVASLVY